MDYGPAKKTGRIADLSDKLAADLGVSTDKGTVTVKIPLPGSPGSIPPQVGAHISPTGIGYFTTALDYALTQLLKGSQSISFATLLAAIQADDFAIQEGIVTLNRYLLLLNVTFHERDSGRCARLRF